MVHLHLLGTWRRWVWMRALWQPAVSCSRNSLRLGTKRIRRRWDLEQLPWSLWQLFFFREWVDFSFNFSFVHTLVTWFGILTIARGHDPLDLGIYEFQTAEPHQLTGNFFCQFCQVKAIERAFDHKTEGLVVNLQWIIGFSCVWLTLPSATWIPRCQSNQFVGVSVCLNTYSAFSIPPRCLRLLVSLQFIYLAYFCRVLARLIAPSRWLATVWELPLVLRLDLLEKVENCAAAIRGFPAGSSWREVS